MIESMEQQLSRAANKLNGDIASVRERLDEGEDRQNYRLKWVEAPLEAAAMEVPLLLKLWPSLKNHQEQLTQILVNPKATRRDLMDLLRDAGVCKEN